MLLLDNSLKRTETTYPYFVKSIFYRVSRKIESKHQNSIRRISLLLKPKKINHKYFEKNPRNIVFLSLVKVLFKL